jgi:hypothetical protein
LLLSLLEYIVPKIAVVLIKRFGIPEVIFEGPGLPSFQNWEFSHLICKDTWKNSLLVVEEEKQCCKQTTLYYALAIARTCNPSTHKAEAGGS